MESAGLIGVLQEARALLALPGNDFVWSCWNDEAHALAEIDAKIAAIRRGTLPPKPELTWLFAPTGPIQETSLSSGWGWKFIELSARFDAAVDHAYRSAG